MTNRSILPDYLRLVALFGIVVVNVQGMGFPLDGGFTAADRQSALDRGVAWLVDGLAFTKSYGLFSFMFGVGLAFQMRSAARRDLPFGRLYRNRMFGLVALGLLHGCLFFPFDILLLYGCAGAILYLMRHWQVRRLVWFGASLVALQTGIAALLFSAGASDEMLVQLEREVMTDGRIWDVVTFKAVSFAVIWPFLVAFQGLAALGWFCLGLAAAKVGLIDDPDHPLWRRARRWCLAPGVTLSLAGAALWHGSEAGETWGLVLLLGASPLATFGYLGGIAALARSPAPVLRPLLGAGASSLSLYLGQSILLSTLFAPYGFGLWQELGAAAAVAMAIATTLVLIGLVILWRLFFALGPFEWLLRRITCIGLTASRLP